ncbi:CpsB/CapC family capsule biosynthesis tyrosine phosphatase [Ruminococcus flavefaciens]|uniref:CpsB/CapC family capsule biosynthesis tyrosine phosphatase n=1 Tax=Ruminococcus flavefaciens TaxID=1265 RepID=UPI0026EFBBB3|nr:CpsB/CapC family capsule biosynthesis tyrosine phosphatase [Ruminococcus flavefaciens]
MTEYHCHILPGIDDGAKDVETSLAMIEMMKAQGVERIVATSHFYAHREKSVAEFLKKRQAAFDKISDKAAVKEIYLGAEVAIENGISELADIEKLAVEGTRMILLELPYRAYSKWMSEEIYNIGAEFNLKVMLAHVHRYLEYYSKDELEGILSTKAVMQINNEAFAGWREKKLVKRIIADEKRFAFGSDAHNLDDRKPNWDLLKKKVKPDVIELSDGILDRYLL